MLRLCSWLKQMLGGRKARRRCQKGCQTNRPGGLALVVGGNHARVGHQSGNILFRIMGVKIIWTRRRFSFFLSHTLARRILDSPEYT